MREFFFIYIVASLSGNPFLGLRSHSDYKSIRLLILKNFSSIIPSRRLVIRFGFPNPWGPEFLYSSRTNTIRVLQMQYYSRMGALRKQLVPVVKRSVSLSKLWCILLTRISVAAILSTMFLQVAVRDDR